MVSLRGYATYGLLILIGYFLLLSTIRLVSGVVGLIFLLTFSLSQLIGLLLVSKVGSANTLSISLSLGSLGMFIDLMTKSYFGNILLGLSAGLYLIALVGVLGLILSSTRFIRYMVYVYSGLLMLGIAISAVFSSIDATAWYIAAIVSTLAIAFYISARPVRFRISRFGLKYVMGNRGVLVAAFYISFTLPYLVASMSMVSGNVMSPLGLLAPLSVYATYLATRRLGFINTLRLATAALSALSLLMYVLKNPYLAIVIVFTSALAYTAVLQLLTLITSPILYMPTLATSYALSTLMMIPVGLALSNITGYLAVGIATAFLILALRLVKEPIYVVSESNG